MKTAVAWVKDALASKDIVQHLTHYLVQDGMIYATDGRIVAAHPFPFKGEPFLVPGTSFEKTLAATRSDTPQLSLDGAHLHIKDGKFRGKIATLTADLWPFDAGHLGKFKAIPEKFITAIRTVRPFVSDNATQPWATAIGFLSEHAMATNNIVIAASHVGKGMADTLLPSWGADFILARTEGLKEWVSAEQYLAFRWENGAWLKVASVHGTFPERALEMINSIDKKDLVEITAEWKSTYLRVAGLTKEHQLALYDDRVVGGSSESLEVEDELETPTPDGEECSYWNPIYLTSVVEVAEKWDPSHWPKPARFAGANIDGIIIGKRPS